MIISVLYRITVQYDSSFVKALPRLYQQITIIAPWIESYMRIESSQREALAEGSPWKGKPSKRVSSAGDAGTIEIRSIVGAGPRPVR
jgi:hypothetical protein